MKEIIFFYIMLLLCACEFQFSTKQSHIEDKRLIQKEYKALIQAVYDKNLQHYLSFFDETEYFATDQNGQLLGSLADEKANFTFNASLIKHNKVIHIRKLSITMLNASQAIVESYVEMNVLTHQNQALTFAGDYRLTYKKKQGRWKITNSSNNVKPMFDNFLDND